LLVITSQWSRALLECIATDVRSFAAEARYFLKPQKVSKNGLSAKCFFAHRAFALQSDEKTQAGTALDPLLRPAHISRSVRPLPRSWPSFFSPLSPEAVLPTGLAGYCIAMGLKPITMKKFALG